MCHHYLHFTARTLSLNMVTLPIFVSLESSSLRTEIQILLVKLMEVCFRESCSLFNYQMNFSREVPSVLTLPVHFSFLSVL